MSHILTNWIQKDLGLEDSFSPVDMNKAFSSGYLFGKLLDTLGFEENFKHQYVSGTTADALIKNYTSLETTLRQKLRVRLSSSAAIDLISGKPGSVAKLLYEIKRTSESMPRHTLLKTKLQTSNFESYPSSPVGIPFLTRRDHHKLG